MADLGYREGYALLGCYPRITGLGWVYAIRGDACAPTPGTVEAWIADPVTFTPVVMVTAYEPAAVNRYPTRAAVHGGERCAFPSVEADALVAAGVAAYA
jgi:hypothetical protein